MKHAARIILVGILLLIVTGCSDGRNAANRVNNGNAVDKIINEQMDKAGAGNTPAGSDQDASVSPEGDSQGQGESAEKSGADVADVDYDITNMSGDMVYATVYQMMADPDAYIGKSVRMDGLYYAGYYEPTKEYYHYCIIQDALACCAQGIEFVWGDGSHIYPDEYPKENAQIVVQGIFETYQEDGDDNLYCRLKDATMQVINKK